MASSLLTIGLSTLRFLALWSLEMAVVDGHMIKFGKNLFDGFSNCSFSQNFYLFILLALICQGFPLVLTFEKTTNSKNQLVKRKTKTWRTFIDFNERSYWNKSGMGERSIADSFALELKWIIDPNVPSYDVKIKWLIIWNVFWRILISSHLSKRHWPYIRHNTQTCFWQKEIIYSNNNLFFKK